MMDIWAAGVVGGQFLDADIDGDCTRTSCRPGEQVCDVCRGESRKRVRAQVGEGEGQAKRARLQDVTPTRQHQIAVQQASRIAE